MSNETVQTEKTVYLAIIPFGWGRGKTPEIALENANNAIGGLRGPHNLKEYAVFELPERISPNVYINDMGGLCYPNAEKENIRKLSDDEIKDLDWLSVFKRMAQEMIGNYLVDHWSSFHKFMMQEAPERLKTAVKLDKMDEFEFTATVL